jgi:uncharacterized protein DUF4375
VRLYATVDHRISRSSVHGADRFERLQALHEAGLRTGRQIVGLTPGMRAVTATFAFVRTLQNGGLVACMQGDAGDFTAEAISAAKLIGADGHAAVIEEFVRLALLGDPSMDGDARERRADEMTDEEHAELERLDDAFLALPDITDLLGDYVEAHPQEFFFDWDEPSPWARCPKLLDPVAAELFVHAIDEAIDPQPPNPDFGPDYDRLRRIRVHVATLLSNTQATISKQELFDYAVRGLSEAKRFE